MCRVLINLPEINTVEDCMKVYETFMSEANNFRKSINPIFIG